MDTSNATTKTRSRVSWQPWRLSLRIVAHLQRRMAEFGIKPEDIATPIAADQERLRAVRYRDAFGHTWEGKGTPPQWVVQATSAGQSLEHFSIGAEPPRESTKRDGVDWRDDPFAGTRLASNKVEHLRAA
ncbi:H-NS family nucleoid-associated regulatory protein [Paraburkholderia sp. J63]|uniref:H-NS family nucleoid-associated regulatory protein n=1 Tax=Paraburkholderia sp. J63 TaxID=2805434 RepID=UPI002ABE306B|nr:H-NS family nucleoid-associated regulatory protein [Paraburkholderia sp. J63]